MGYFTKRKENQARKYFQQRNSGRFGRGGGSSKSNKGIKKWTYFFDKGPDPEKIRYKGVPKLPQETKNKDIEKKQKQIALNLFSLNPMLNRYGANLKTVSTKGNEALYNLKIGNNIYPIEIPKTGSTKVREKIIKEGVLGKMAKRSPEKAREILNAYNEIEQPYMVLGESPSGERMTSPGIKKKIREANKETPDLPYGGRGSGLRTRAGSKKTLTLSERLADHSIAAIFLILAFMTLMKSGLITGLAIDAVNSQAFTVSAVFLLMLIVILLSYKFTKK